MYFANPAVLWSLFALAIPVLVHLFNFRRFKKVYFSNVALLREIKIDTQSINRLKHILVLAARLLAFISIILAFAQPYLKNNKNESNQGSTAVSIFIDNSYSMNAENKSGNLMDGAKKAAKEIALAFKPSDKFQLLTNDFEGRHQRLVSRDEFLEMLENVDFSSTSKSFQQISLRQADLLREASQQIKKAYVISDFQKSLYQFENLKSDSSYQTVCVPFSANITSNIFIDSIWFDKPNHTKAMGELLHVKVRASGTEEINLENIPLKLYVNNEQKALASFTLTNENYTTVDLNYTNTDIGLQQCKIEIQDYPISFDDVFYFEYDVAEHISVTSINGYNENKYIHSLFAEDNYFNYLSLSSNSFDYSKLSKTDFLICNEIPEFSSGMIQEFERYIKSGGSALIVPSREANISSYNQLFSEISVKGLGNWDTVKTKVERINNAHILYNDIFDKQKLKVSNIDLPQVFGYFENSKITKRKSESLLQMRNGNDFLYSAKVGKGRIFVCVSPFNTDYSNFVKHALYVPSIYKMAITSVRNTQPFYTIGESEIVNFETETTTSEQMFHIKNQQKKFDIIPETKMVNNKIELALHQQIKESGNYQLLIENKIVGGLAFNYSKSESIMNFFEADDLKSEILKSGNSNFSILANKGKSFTQTINEMNTGISLWKTFIFFSLLFILIEVLLLSPLVRKFYNNFFPKDKSY